MDRMGGLSIITKEKEEVLNEIHYYQNLLRYVLSLYNEYQEYHASPLINYSLFSRFATFGFL